MASRVTSATLKIDWGIRLHSHALMIYGKNKSQSKNYEEYALKISTKQWTLESAVKGFWGQGHRVPDRVYEYFVKNPVTTKPKGFENGVKIQFEFGVAKVFDTGKALLTVSLKNVPRKYINYTLELYVKHVHRYIEKIGNHRDFDWYNTQLQVEKYSWEIVSLNSTGVLFDKHINLSDFYEFCSKKNTNVFYDSEYHKGYLQLYYQCQHKKNTVCVYHTGKFVIMGVRALDSLNFIEESLKELSGDYELKLLEDILNT